MATIFIQPPTTFADALRCLKNLSLGWFVLPINTFNNIGVTHNV